MGPLKKSFDPKLFFILFIIFVMIFYISFSSQHNSLKDLLSTHKGEETNKTGSEGLPALSEPQQDEYNRKKEEKEEESTEEILLEYYVEMEKEIAIQEILLDPGLVANDLTSEEFTETQIPKTNDKQLEPTAMYTDTDDSSLDTIPDDHVTYVDLLDILTNATNKQETQPSPNVSESSIETGEESSSFFEVDNNNNKTVTPEKDNKTHSLISYKPSAIDQAKPNPVETEISNNATAVTATKQNNETKTDDKSTSLTMKLSKEETNDHNAMNVTVIDVNSGANDLEKQQIYPDDLEEYHKQTRTETKDNSMLAMIKLLDAIKQKLMEEEDALE